jgi:hypothetical protein
MKPVILSAVASAFVVVLVSGTACKQPKVTCSTAQGAFIFHYMRASGGPSCDARKGEVVGIRVYGGVEEEGRPTFDSLTLALRPSSTGEHWDRAVGANATSLGSESLNALGPIAETQPDDAGFCRALRPIELAVDLPALPEVPSEDGKSPATPATPARVVKYTWSNLRFFASAANYGTQAEADVRIVEGGTECSYHALALYPAVDCSSPSAVPNESVPDDSKCSSDPDLDAGRVLGSGIGPDLATKCDPDLLTCVLARETLPSFK